MSIPIGRSKMRKPQAVEQDPGPAGVVDQDIALAEPPRELSIVGSRFRYQP